MVLTPHTPEEAREPQGSLPSGPEGPSKSPLPAKRRGDKRISESSPDGTGTEEPRRRLRKPLIKPLESLGRESLQARVAVLVKHLQEAKEGQPAKAAAAAPRGRQKQATVRPPGGPTPKQAALAKFALPALVMKSAPAPEVTPPVPCPSKTRRPNYRHNWGGRGGREACGETASPRG